MGWTIKNLGAFVRNESEPISRVDIFGVIEAALELTATRFTQAGVGVCYSIQQLI